ncbi:ribonuclease H-like protein, partial [Polychaeton citri CBS 116435]
AAQFWKYNLYVDLSGKPPSRHYCTTYEQAESQAAHFLNIPVVGFDLEWDSRAIAGKSDIKRLVSLIQVASETRIGLFQVSLFRGTKGEDLVPPTLRKILESPSIIKAGVNVAGDATRMSKYLGVEMRGLFELSHLYKLVNYPRFPLNKRLVGLAAIVQDEFSMPLSKDEVRVSNWAQKLDNEQIDYACSDAYAGFQLFHSLESKRRKMDPRPP